MPRSFRAHAVVCLLLAGLLAGCGGSPQAKPRASEAKRSAARDVDRTDAAPRKDERRDPEPVAAEPEPVVPEPIPVAPVSDAVAARPPQHQPGNRERHSLADLLKQPADSASRWIENLPRMKVDDARAAAQGIRKLSSKRLVLYTDLPAADAIDRIPAMFDQAFPQWCEYFGIDPAAHADWHMTGFLMKDKARFQRASLLPDGLPQFQHGYAWNFEFWLYEQPSDYYRAHLALHEGTHGFMNTVLGGCGPPWYMEGMAELLSTHLWENGRLSLRHVPRSREEVPYWGRIRIVKDAVAARKAMRLKKVIDYPPHAHLETEPYAWCWAVATLLDRHPSYRQRFRGLHKHVLASDFNQRFHRAFEADWDELDEQWQLLVTGLEYGHDVSKTVVDFTPGEPLPQSGASVKVSAQKGWQNSGLQLNGGTSYRLRASGRYQVADRPQTWWCEPGGVSIRYYRGRPLGVLLAAVRPEGSKSASSAMLRPKVVGLGTSLRPETTGTLFLRINDSAAELDDNAGELTVKIGRE